MRIEIAITSTLIEPSGALPAELAGQVGAIAEFQGRVRDQEAGRIIAALEYEAYTPMAQRLIRRILEEIATHHPCLLARVTHRLGVVPVGEAAIQVVVAARHRAEAFALLAEFMDRLKQDVPIWKRRALTLDDLAWLKTP